MNEPKSSEQVHIECGPGWAGLYQPLIDRCRAEGVDIHQIKEKFGGLRFYVGVASQELHAAIDEAERKSFMTCEECGESGLRVSSRGRLRTRCDRHAVGKNDVP